MALLIAPLFTAGIAVGGIPNAMAGDPEPKTIVVDADGAVGHSSPRNTAQCDGTRISDVEITITAAIAAAGEGDTIIVCPGDYDETVEVDKSYITIKGIAQPIVDGDQNTAFFILANGVHLTGFDVTSGGTDCILVVAEDVRLHGNIASGCGFNGMTVVGDRNTISGNTVNLNSFGGIEVKGDDNTIRGNIVNGNDDNNGISIDGDGNTIQGNIANGNDTNGIFLSASSDDNSVKGNTANDNFSFGFRDDGSPDNDFRQNKCSGNIGGGSNTGDLCKPQV